jgi:putative AdoMet-dependent methyltransferase
MAKYNNVFNKWALVYDEEVAKASATGEWMFGGYDRVLDKVVEYCQLRKNSYFSVLDIGIGTGNLAARFLPYGLQVSGIEPSAEMRKICRRKFSAIKVMSGDFLKFPRSLPKFDLIVSAYAFHHLTAAEKCESVRLMKTILKLKGGIVIADFMFSNAAGMESASRVVREQYHADLQATFDGEYPGFYDDLTLDFSKEGFKVEGEQLTISVWIVRACL